MNPHQYLAYPSKRLAAEAAVGAALSKAGARFLRKRAPASLPDLAAAASGLYLDSRKLLADGPWPCGDFGADYLAELTADHADLRFELAKRYRETTLPFPGYWSVEAGTSFLLYALVRALRPSTVLEMGVGNGHSSFFILRALEMNSNGTLYSFDVEPGAGGLLSQRERARWELRLIDRRRPPGSLVAHLRSMPRAELCFHDADHGYLAQLFEFERLWSQLGDSGVLVADDVDASHALLDFCANIGEEPRVLVDERKVVGILARTPARASSG